MLKSNIVGKPLALLLSRKDCNATVTLCHTGTKDLKSITKDADIVVSAAGMPHTIRADIDYGTAEAHTTYGCIGIKCWIYKGEILPEAKKAPQNKREGSAK